MTCPALSKIVKLTLIGLFTIAVVWAANIHIPRGMSSWKFRHSEGIPGPLISDQFADNPAHWANASDDAIVLFALGDTGTGEEGQYAVGNALNTAAGLDHPSCVILLGDNFYSDGVQSADDPKWQTRFEIPYAGEHLQIPFYACLGNQDHNGNAHAQIDSKVKDKRWHMPDFNYTFFPDPERADLLEVFVLDTNPLFHDPATFEQSLQHLRANLAKSNALWKIVVGHHPIQSGGFASYHNWELKNRLLNLLVEHKVDLYLCGHDHHMEMGTVDNLTTYAVLGSGAKLESRIVLIPNLHFAAPRLGFAKLKVSSEQMVICFTTDKGKEIYTTEVTKR